MDNEYCKCDDPGCCSTGQNTLADIMLTTIGAEIAAENYGQSPHLDILGRTFSFGRHFDSG